MIKVTNKEIKREDQENMITNGDKLRIMTSFQQNNIPSRGAKSQLKTLYCREFDKHAVGTSHRNSETEEYFTSLNPNKDRMESMRTTRKNSNSPDNRVRSPYREDTMGLDY